MLDQTVPVNTRCMGHSPQQQQHLPTAPCSIRRQLCAPCAPVWCHLAFMSLHERCRELQELCWLSPGRGCLVALAPWRSVLRCRMSLQRRCRASQELCWPSWQIGGRQYQRHCQRRLLSCMMPLSLYVLPLRAIGREAGTSAQPTQVACAPEDSVAGSTFHAEVGKMVEGSNVC